MKIFKTAETYLCRALIALVTLYRRIISPLLPAACRFYPSCSVYASQALATHGLFEGMRRALWRVARCHPFAQGGLDLVDPAQPTKECSHG